MSDLNQRILQASQQDRGLHSKDQKDYLGTFGERVVLTALLSDCRQEKFQKDLPVFLTKIRESYPKVSLKINAKLASSQQVTILQEAQSQGMTATVVDDTSGTSPYGIVIHTDKAENCPKTDVREVFPEFFVEKTQSEQGPATAKKGFWQKLFGK